MAYRTLFTVRGAGIFPFDMLRYDASYPRTGEAVSALEPGEHGRSPRDVELVHVDADPGWRPTEGRWNSFLWAIVPDAYMVRTNDGGGVRFAYTEERLYERGH